MTTIDLEQIKDCDHCSYTFGSFGCCVTVNNEWVYSCREGQREYLIDRIVEIVDSYMPFNGNSITNKCVSGFLKNIRKDILALKGENRNED